MRQRRWQGGQPVIREDEPFDGRRQRSRINRAELVALEGQHVERRQRAHHERDRRELRAQDKEDAQFAQLTQLSR